jgi:adenosylhomocysteine nucleosidase
VVVISADAEWEAVCEQLAPASRGRTPFGEWFEQPILLHGTTIMVAFVHGGWGKISAAASCQHAIGWWSPQLLVNLGTCGGFAGRVGLGEILLVERAVVYDILEQMGDPEEHLNHYSTWLDLSWLSSAPPQPVRRGVMVSADRDLLPGDIPWLVERYGAMAADWESGAIAWVAARCGVRCLILRGVSDLVSPFGDDVYGNITGFRRAAQKIMIRLLADLPDWLTAAGLEPDRSKRAPA